MKRFAVLFAVFALSACAPKLETPADLQAAIAESDRLGEIAREAERVRDDAQRAASDASTNAWRQKNVIEQAGYVVDYDIFEDRIDRVYVRGALVYER